jgi:hypothetical protein
MGRCDIGDKVDALMGSFSNIAGDMIKTGFSDDVPKYKGEIKSSVSFVLLLC